MYMAIQLHTTRKNTDRNSPFNPKTKHSINGKDLVIFFDVLMHRGRLVMGFLLPVGC